MNFEIKDLFSDLEVLKDRFEDLKDNHGWHFDDYYPYETNHVLTKDETIRDGCTYHERRIHNDQMFGLLRLYTQQFDDILKKFHEIEKASSDMNSLATKSDNA
ncbi:type II toxin-antitoxin system toxin TscT [Staphylococcus borealis]|uniref:DUF1474 family protein n=1 Tax=Staphylococcus borealis TaxID=2742203 RepID=A0ABX2LG97_9STAP|nr:DUF1474 family protein [Staphylococcus borealis]MEB6611091.1 DUF1474 family protein [Staphylococcus borealis]MEB7458794.1 DUF1474 family protein [Staphylococcus borealis]MUN94095.1 DUF1474 family protein [Staphylococcus borealis]NUI78830.1 DUF1474 family protein [Staphylococcus borealis]NUI81343.1 DUF1474 family protein [Staphylococcus borealis]